VIVEESTENGKGFVQKAVSVFLTNSF
jgi:hypothetical protein